MKGKLWVLYMYILKKEKNIYVYLKKGNEFHLILPKMKLEEEFIELSIV